MSKIPVRGSRMSGLPRPSTRLPRRTDPRRPTSSESFRPDHTFSAEREHPQLQVRDGLLGARATSRSPDFVTDLKVGDTVLVDGESGTLRFLGDTMFADGIWAGVDLARPIGKNDGSVNGSRYFFCQRQHGLFAPVDKVARYDPVPPSPSPPPLLATPKRCVINLDLALDEPLTSSATSTPLVGAVAAMTSPPEELWWDGDNTANILEPSLAEEILPDEHLQDMEEEFSLGILTPDQMDTDMGSMLRSEDFSRSLDPLSPSGAGPECAMEGPSSPTSITRTFTAEDVETRASIPKEGAAMELQHPDVPMTLDREQEWEDEFDDHHTRTCTVKAVSETFSIPASTLRSGGDQAEEPALKGDSHAASDGPTSEPACSPVAQESAANSNSTFTWGDVTTSMSSESSDVTVKNDSNGAGEALAEPPSPNSVGVPSVAVAPEASAVPDVGCASMTSVVSASDIELAEDIREQEREADAAAMEQPETAENKKELISSVGPERVKSVVFSEPEVPLGGSTGGAGQEMTRSDPVASCATSTTSIDGGYQGDSEFDTGTPSEDPARPPPRLEVLTDSDFCSEGAAGTESEAEHRLTDVDMESSGVYSDAESRRSAEPDREPIEAIAETVETVLSPLRETPSELEPTSVGSSPSHSSASVTASASATTAEQPPASRGVRPRDPIPSHIVKAREPPPKKEPIKMNHPLPRRNVQSKLRTMLETPAVGPPDVRRPQRTPRKGRWDAVMKNIEKGKSEEKLRPRREVKSRVFEGVIPPKDGSQAGASRRNLIGGQQRSRTGSTHTLTGSRTSLRPAGSRSVSPTCSEVSTGSSASARSRGSMHSPGSNPSARSPSGSSPSLVSGRPTLIPALRRNPGSASTTTRSGGKQPAATARLVAASASRAALDVNNRRQTAVLTNKTNIANNQTQGTRTSKPTTRAPTGSRSQNKVQNKSTPKDAKPVSLKPAGPSAAAAAAAAAAARHEVQVSQLEGQLAAHQRDLQTARTDLQHAARCFDAAMVMVNYISNEYNPLQLTEEVKALKSRATEIQLKLDEAAATQRRLEETLEERERARLHRQTEHQTELSTLNSAHQEALQARQQEIAEVRDAWHRERELQEAELTRQQERRDEDLRQLAAQHQEMLASVRQQWERELADCQQRAQTEAEALRQQIDELKELNEELTRREEELKTAMGQSTNAKIQVLSARVKEKEKDIRSLNVVLELKKEEIAALRRDQHELQHLRDHKAKLEERYTKARAKAEDLEAQLRQRYLVERQLSEENNRLRDYQDKETKANKRLSMENEQLQYKLRNQTESSLCSSSGALSRSASFRSPRCSVSRMCSSDSAHVPSRMSPRSPLKSESLRRRSRRSEESSPPPQVTAVVEKSDSISWVVGLERYPSRRTSSAEPEEGAGDSPSLTYADWRRGLCGASRSPPSANGVSVAGSESSDSELAEHEHGVFYQLNMPAAASAPSSLTPGTHAAPLETSIEEIPESAEGTEI